MSKKIKIELSEKSINDAIRQVQDYKQSLTAKVEELVSRLAQRGISSINTTMMTIAPVDRGTYAVQLVYNKSGDKVRGALIQLTGDQVLFVEFSAGKLFGVNSFPSLPNNSSYGSDYGAGTYPGKGHWDDPEGWWYVDGYGEPQHTYGVRAYAPMYNADMDMRAVLEMEAQAVFGGR